MRSIVVSIFIVFIVVLSGCVYPGGEQTETPPPVTGGVLTPQEKPATETVSDSHPIPHHPNQTEISTDVVDRHETALREKGTFTAYVSDTTNPNRINLTYKIDLDNTRYITRTHWSNTSFSPGGIINAYTTQTKTYEQLVFNNGSTNYRVWNHDSPSELSLATTAPDAIRPDFLIDAENISYIKTTVTQENGQTFTTYQTNESRIRHQTRTVLGTNTASEVVNVTATLIIDGSGIIRHHDWTITVVQPTGSPTDGDRTTRTFHAVYKFDQIGTTQVVEPDWTETAREKTE